MKNIKDKALEISKRFPFSPFKSQTAAVNEHGRADEDVASCENHLDDEFMELLEQGSHLDTTKMPL